MTEPCIRNGAVFTRADMNEMHLIRIAFELGDKVDQVATLYNLHIQNRSTNLDVDRRDDDAHEGVIARLFILALPPSCTATDRR